MARYHEAFDTVTREMHRRPAAIVDAVEIDGWLSEQLDYVLPVVVRDGRVQLREVCT